MVNMKEAKTRVWKIQRGKKTFAFNYFMAVATLTAYFYGLVPFWALLLTEGLWINNIIDRHTARDDERRQRILNEI